MSSVPICNLCGKRAVWIHGDRDSGYSQYLCDDHAAIKDLSDLEEL